MTWKEKNKELSDKNLKVSKLMKDNEQKNFIDMLKRNEFTENQIDMDELKQKLEFDMDYMNAVIMNKMYQNNLYFIIIHLIKVENTQLKRPVLSIIHAGELTKEMLMLKGQIFSESIIEKNFHEKKERKCIILDKQPLTQSVRENIEIDQYNFEFVEQTGILYFLFNKFEEKEQNLNDPKNQWPELRKNLLTELWVPKSFNFNDK